MSDINELKTIRMKALVKVWGDILTSENLIMVFETLCLMAFPDSLTKDAVSL
jgi:hypothetical protein